MCMKFFHGKENDKTITTIKPEITNKNYTAIANNLK